MVRVLSLFQSIVQIEAPNGKRYRRVLFSMDDAKLSNDVNRANVKPGHYVSFSLVKIDKTNKLKKSTWELKAVNVTMQ